MARTGRELTRGDNAGKATCARCDLPIEPGDEWHLDHNESRDGYIGVSHASCNLAAGAHKVNGKRRTVLHDQPLRWSQRWFEDPPVGTVNLDGGRNPELYLGNGEWQPL